MKRSGPLKRSPMPRSTKPLPRVSAKRRSQLSTRRAVVAQVRRRDVTCRAAALMPDVACGGRLAVHEPEHGAYRIDAWLDADRCILCCDYHHFHLHQNPALAFELGLLVHGNGDA